MKLKSATIVGGAVGIALLAAGVQAGKTPIPRTSRTTQVMPKPKQLKPNTDGRTYAVIQLCWEPATSVGSPHIVIGPLDRGVTNLSAPVCTDPWIRKGLVSVGDRVALAWVMNAEARAKIVRWRITLNNRMRMEGADEAQSKLYACVVGTPPCELP